MHFEITASMQSVRKPMTLAQRNSSLFAEAPRIGGQTLRRGQVLKFTPEQFKAQEVMLKRLFDAGAIEISQVDGERRRDMRSEQENMGNVQAELKRAAASDAPPTPPKPSAPPPAVIALPPPPPEPVVAAPATPMEEAGFVSPEKLVAAVDAENKQTAEQIEKAVEAIAPVEDVTPVVPTPAPSQPSQPVHHEKASSKKGRK